MDSRLMIFASTKSFTSSELSKFSEQIMKCVAKPLVKKRAPHRLPQHFLDIFPHYLALFIRYLTRGWSDIVGYVGKCRNIQPNPTESDQIRPNPTESDRIRPNPTESDQIRLNPTESAPCSDGCCWLLDKQYYLYLC